jgi:NAD(P)H-nitrite reductase large subunit
MQDDSNRNEENTESTESQTNEDRIKLLARIVCICKGINLARVLKGLDGSETVDDVNRKTGCGTGGCRGERCGPRIKQLLRKKKQQSGLD